MVSTLIGIRSASDEEVVMDRRYTLLDRNPLYGVCEAVEDVGGCTQRGRWQLCIYMYANCRSVDLKGW